MTFPSEIILLLALNAAFLMVRFLGLRTCLWLCVFMILPPLLLLLGLTVAMNITNKEPIDIIGDLSEHYFHYRIGYINPVIATIGPPFDAAIYKEHRFEQYGIPFAFGGRFFEVTECGRIPHYGLGADADKGRLTVGFPTTGGVLMKALSPVEMIWMGIDRFEKKNDDIIGPPPYRAVHSHSHVSRVQADDDFAKKLRQLGAEWWPSEWKRTTAAVGLRGSFPADREKAKWVVETGWVEDQAKGNIKKMQAETDNVLGECSTRAKDLEGKAKRTTNSGGVWVLKYRLNDRRYKHISAEVRRLLPRALNMTERVEIIKRLGGKFYANAEDCPDLKWGKWINRHLDDVDEELARLQREMQGDYGYDSSDDDTCTLQAHMS